MDSGDIILQKKISIEIDDTTETLFSRMIPLGKGLLKETLHLVFEGRAPRVKQNHSEASLAPRLTKADGKISWNEPAHVIVNRIRGLVPWPVAFTHLNWKGRNYELRVFKGKAEMRASSQPGTVIQSNDQGLLVGCGQGGVLIEEIQLEGSRRMGIQDFLRGHPISVGTKLEG
jgi:methionyl-tRNA formyltransferase